GPGAAPRSLQNPRTAPLAPVGLSTTTGGPSRSCSLLPTMRATVSGKPPGAWVTTKRSEGPGAGVWDWADQGAKAQVPSMASAISPTRNGCDNIGLPPRDIFRTMIWPELRLEYYRRAPQSMRRQAPAAGAEKVNHRQRIGTLS